jgi:hypothetical protein
MCTASNYITDNHYFGRNFDYEISYNERVTVTPRNYEFKFRKIEDIKTHDYYKGYDNETLEWMGSLGNKYAWFSSEEIVIMDKWDSDKIPSQYVCDASFYEIFSCNVLEKHPLGDVQYPKDVLFVKNVEYIGENVVYYEV